MRMQRGQQSIGYHYEGVTNEGRERNGGSHTSRHLRVCRSASPGPASLSGYRCSRGTRS